MPASDPVRVPPIRVSRPEPPSIVSCPSGFERRASSYRDCSPCWGRARSAQSLWSGAPTWRTALMCFGSPEASRRRGPTSLVSFCRLSLQPCVWWVPLSSRARSCRRCARRGRSSSRPRALRRPQWCGRSWRGGKRATGRPCQRRGCGRIRGTSSGCSTAPRRPIWPLEGRPWRAPAPRCRMPLYSFGGTPWEKLSSHT